MKISVITMQNVPNYGSVLQSYATKSYFENKGYEVEFVDYYSEQMRNYGSVKQLYIDALAFHKSKFKSIVVAILKFPSVRNMQKKFSPFVNKHFNLSQKYQDQKSILLSPPTADIYCTGSDQVWNNYWNNRFDETYFLNFAPKGKKKISFSASFGRDDILDSELSNVKLLLEDYSAISVRENSGLDILKDVKNPKKACTLDPSFMLNKQDWLKIAEPIPYKDYILVYKLHEDSAVSKIAIEIGKITGKKVIRISTDFLKRIFGGKTIVAPKIGEFISYINNAALVVTDSFHATAFSINLNVPFISVKWRMFNDRIETLLKKTNLLDRSVSTVDEAIRNFNKPIDYSATNQIIQKLRLETDNFISESLKENYDD